MNDLTAPTIRELKANQRTCNEGPRYGYNTINDNDEAGNCLILFDNRAGIAYGLDPHTGDSVALHEELENMNSAEAKHRIRNLIAEVCLPTNPPLAFATWHNLNRGETPLAGTSPCNPETTTEETTTEGATTEETTGEITEETPTVTA